MRKLAITALAALTMVAPVAGSANAAIICNDAGQNCRRVATVKPIRRVTPPPYRQQVSPTAMLAGAGVALGVIGLLRR